ncbi:cytoplasmic dynein 1 light intermediate chain 2-like isoform X1 [Centruroides sculpturatus]|uniref:cytoplasmic dynein 1 light intermediate chain 2-like isoform X1 n=1 Tax=Centruroides sculpturatus TaxID=218467 RepID=UPI000C6DF488|nr:cytoplasmic dynein 1 light intermediate chain 2-like isoform X1 [Centruroides sculpturatus]
MAPVGEKKDEILVMNGTKDDNNGQNIWSTILSQVQASSPNKLPSNKLLLVLGDNESGKTSLIAKLQGNDDPKKGSGLEYHYIYIRDEYRDDHTRLGVWVVDGDPWHRNLLKFVLNDETLPHTTVLLTASMTQPWNILESLQNWALILDEHIDRLRLPQEILEQHRQRILKRFQDYIEPGDEIEGVTSPLKRTFNFGEEDSLLTLGENTLIQNLGIDIAVIITKTDYMSVLEKDYDYKEEHFDFIQQAIRKFCLQYGASLFYVSVKEDKNCDLLYNYLVHRIYNFPFKTPALVVEKDAIFIPSGWDNDKKIAILYENLVSVKPDDSYTDVISKPITRKPMQRESEVTSEDDQLFLSKQQSLLVQQVPPTGRPQESPIRSPAGVQKTADRRLSGSPGVQASPKKMEGMKSAAGSEGVLQNFFNSLLNRKTGPTATTGSAVRSPALAWNSLPDKSAVRNDAAAELDRMTRMKKPISPAHSNVEGSSSSPADDSSNPSS